MLLRTRAQRELSLDDESQFAALVRAAFAHRRKTLVNSLKDEGYDPVRIAGALERGTLSMTIRAEVLSLEQLIDLARLLRVPV